MRFPGQHEGERVEFLIRKHWIIDAKVTIITVFFYVVPAMILLSLIIAYWPDFFENYMGLIILIFLIYLLYTGLALYIKWLNEELDLMIVTNLRIINLEQVSFMTRTVSEANLTQIQDVKGIQKGVLSNTLHYGDLEIDTASHKRVFFIEDISNPFDTARKLLAIRDANLKQTS